MPAVVQPKQIFTQQFGISTPNPTFGDCFIWTPGSIYDLRMPQAVNRLGIARTGSVATTGISSSSASYASLIGKQSYFGQKAQWLVLVGRLSTSAATSFVFGCGQPSLGKCAVNLSIPSGTKLEVAANNGAWKAYSVTVSHNPDLDFVAGYSLDSAGLLSLFWNGQLIGQQSGWGSTIPTPATPPTVAMSYASGANTNLYGNGTQVNLVAFGNCNDPFTVMQNLSKNPWNIYKTD